VPLFPVSNSQFSICLCCNIMLRFFLLHPCDICNSTQNIFMLGNGRLVLGDLGISKVLEGTMDFASTCIGTPYYMSPEIFKNKPYNHKSDIWALGCVLYEMTTLKHAFDAQSINGLACKIIKGKYPPCDPKYSKHLRGLIAAMLSTR
jgi:serine/threonine protein kinase